MKKWRGFFLFIAILIEGSPASALTIDDLDPENEWWIKDLTITGNTRFSPEQLRAEVVTKNTALVYALADPSTIRSSHLQNRSGSSPAFLSSAPGNTLPKVSLSLHRTR